MGHGTINLYGAGRSGTFLVTCLPGIGALESLGLRVGSRVSVQNRYGWGGPVLLRVEDSFEIALGKDIASQIFVREAPPS